MGDDPNQKTAPLALFPLGQIVATPNALAQVSHEDILGALGRHICGDWGTVDKHDWGANNRALVEETRLLSAYESGNKVRFWIITEADRSVTTILLPEDY